MGVADPGEGGTFLFGQGITIITADFPVEQLAVELAGLLIAGGSG